VTVLSIYANLEVNEFELRTENMIATGYEPGKQRDAETQQQLLLKSVKAYNGFKIASFSALITCCASCPR
jgi:hypothetical protein